MTSLLRWFWRSKTPVTGGAAVVGAAPRRSSGPVSVTGSERSAPALVGPNAAAYGAASDEPSPALLAEQLRQQLEASLRQFNDELVERGQRADDALLLLRALRDDPIRGVRQLPVAAQRALSLLRSEAQTKLLVNLFERDPAMTQSLLRQANSTFYNPSGGRILSLTDSVTRMGRAGVQAVLMEQTAAGMVSRPGGALDAMAQQVWNHMVRVAPMARQLALCSGVPAEQAFLLGLLHDVGKLVIFDRVTVLRTRHRRTLNIDAQIISRALRLLHEPLGGLVVQDWGLDSDIARAIGLHHREPAPAHYDALGEVIYVAERVDLMMQRQEVPNVATIQRSGALLGDVASMAAALAIPYDVEADAAAATIDAPAVA